MRYKCFSNTHLNLNDILKKIQCFLNENNKRIRKLKWRLN